MTTATVPKLFQQMRAALVMIATIGLMLAVTISAIAQQTLPPPELTPADRAHEDEVNRPTANAPLLPPPIPDQQAVAPEPILPPPVPPPQVNAAPDDTPPTLSEPSSEIAAILSRLDALEKSAAKPADEKKPAETSMADDWTDMSTEKWTVKLGGHVQMDFVHWLDAEDPPVLARDYFEFRRLRLLADGVGYGVYDFRLQIDIEPESEDTVTTPVTVVKDAYLSANELPYFDRARIGNFFVPFSLEQVTNDTNNIFMDRSIPTQGIFAADREVGVAFYGVNDAKDFTYTFGTFIDSISEALKERLDDNQGQRFSGRLTWSPYYDEPSNGRYMVHTGIGLLHTEDQDDLVRFRARPQIHEGPFLIDTGNLAAGNFTSANAEFATVWGPVSFQSELFATNVNLHGTDDAQLYGAYAYISYFLTGENRIYERYGQHGAQFGRNVPYSNFFWVPGCCGPGAWETKARWSNLNLRDVNSGEYNDLTLGFNWYWTDRIRIMFDYIHPVTTGGSAPFGATDSDIIATRFDFNW